MNITKYLCKKFDKENKGYVTIGDVILAIIDVILILTVFFIMSFFIGIAYNRIFLVEDPSIIYTCLIGSAIILIICIVVLIADKFWMNVLKIKIVKCPIKKE